MFRTMLSSKIHMATVTEANLHYIGSITIDQDILDVVDVLENERVQVVNINNGQRWETYALSGPRGSGVIALNGAGARLVQVGDEVIIMIYQTMTDEEAKKHIPKVVLMSKKNTIEKILQGEEPFTEFRHTEVE